MTIAGRPRVDPGETLSNGTRTKRSIGIGIVGVLGALALVPIGPGTQAGAAVGPSSWSTICPGRAGAAGTKFVTHAANCRVVTVGGLARRYVAYVPSAAADGRKVPVVFMFHGSSGSGEQFYSISGWKEVAEKQGFIAVFPTGRTYKLLEGGMQTKWHSFRLRCEVSPTRPQGWPASSAYPADDAGFVDRMLADLRSTIGIDDERVYASGFSNGSGFAQTLAVKRADVFAAVGSWAGVAGECIGANGAPVEAIVPPHLQNPKRTAVPIALGLGSKDAKFLDGVNDALRSLGQPTITEFKLDQASVEKYLVSALTRTRNANGLALVSGTPIGVNQWAGVAWRPTWPAPVYSTLQWNTPVAGNTAGNSFTFMLLKGVAHKYPNARSGSPSLIKQSGSVHAATLFWDFFQRYTR